MTATTQDPPETLQRVDRCDACGVAQAHVRVSLLSGTIDLCGHHFTINEPTLRDQAIGIIDERDE